jgi:MoxR-like ATPase
MGISKKVALAELRDSLHRSMAGRVVALESQLDQLLIAWLAGGHCLLSGIAGAAKSRLVREFAARMALKQQWLSMTSQLGTQDLVTLPMRQANLLLVENVNRCGEQIRASLLDVVSHGSVPVGDEVLQFANPLMVVATSNRFETNDITEPDWDQDKFLFEIQLDYPDYEAEFELITGGSGVSEMDDEREPLCSATDLPSFRKEIHEVEVPAEVAHYVVRLIRGPRLDDGDIHDFAVEWLTWGAGPRASENLLRTARARAATFGRNAVTHQDVKELIHPVLRHRLVRNQNAIDNEVSIDKIIDRLLYEIDERVEGDTQGL